METGATPVLRMMDLKKLSTRKGARLIKAAFSHQGALSGAELFERTTP
jgi:hypothetical protein